MPPLLLEVWSTADGLYLCAALEGFRNDLFIVERQFPNSHLGGTSWVVPD